MIMARTTRLEIAGRIKFDQFWPEGKSDADTTKLLLTVDRNSMRVKLAGQNNFMSTQAYQDAGILAAVDEDTGQRKIMPLIKSNTLTIRLQRIDAPELHYRPDARGSEGALKGTGLIKDYRQHQAETAVVKLAQFLQSFGSSSLNCTFTSELKATEGPGAAIDKYGRFVGDIILPDGTNLNLWLLEQGLAVVALYDSMLPTEIDESVAAWRRGRSKRTGIARHYSARFTAFDGEVVYRPVGSAIANETTRKFIHPKFYRRQTSWWAFMQAEIFEGDFGDWLTEKNEHCWYLPEFREDGRRARKQPLYERETDGNGISWEPEDFIFAESQSSLYRANAAGVPTKVLDW
jgi:endonuclease YncB( thermonuclease family)